MRLPFTLDLLRRLEIMLQQYGQDGDEQARIAKEDLFGVQNSRKALVRADLPACRIPRSWRKKEPTKQALRTGSTPTRN